MVNYEHNSCDRLLVYTRKVCDKSYPAGLANSLHLAVSRNGNPFEPLHQNYGVMFETASLGADDTICPKGIKAPWVFSLKSGGYGILAIRVNEDDSPDEESTGRVLLWTTENFVDFGRAGMLDLGLAENIVRVRCVYEEQEDRYVLRSETCGGEIYGNRMETAAGKWVVSAPERAAESGEKLFPENEYSPGDIPEGCIPGNTVLLDHSFCDRLTERLGRIVNVGIRLPGQAEADCAERVEEITAAAVYSDGSTAPKKVQWDLSGVDFARPGVYEITGKVLSPGFEFPLACGYGDPVLFFWEGKWYFIATNDNLNDIGLYVREADSPEGLFAEDIEEHLILGLDEERGFVQTFWAPEFHVIGGELYLLFAVSSSVWGPQCHLMRLKKGKSIICADSWEEPVRIRRQNGAFLDEDGITLDMTYLRAGGCSYMVWSYRRHIGTPKDTGSMLYIAKVQEETPWQLSGEPVLLTRPLLGWENVSGTINNEGPHGFVMNGRVYLTYSGGSANAYTYALGLLTAEEGADLTEISSWTKSDMPVLSFVSVEGEYGPGHNSFFRDVDGNLMIAYHAEDAIDHTLRCDGIRRVHFDREGRPDFEMSKERDLAPEFEKVSLQIRVP